MTRSIVDLVRPHITKLKPYRSARDEFTGSAHVYLDANENALGSPVSVKCNRYPDPHQRKIKELLATQKALDPACIFIGHGSDEAVDLLIRALCIPGRDEIIITPPTYGMYKVSADIHDIHANEVPLLPDFSLDAPSLLNTISDRTKIVFLCSPNNPTGNVIAEEQIEMLLAQSDPIVVVDEAYVDFSSQPSWTNRIKEYEKLVVLQTFSKGWGMAGLRVGMAYGNPFIIDMLSKIKPPYNINQLSQGYVEEALLNKHKRDIMVGELLVQRELLAKSLSELRVVKKVYPSEANFLLVEVVDALKLYEALIGAGVIVRNRANVLHCTNCLRISVGTREENEILVTAIKTITGQK